MNIMLRIVVLVVSVTMTFFIVGLAYFSNYESILEKPNIYLILVLLFINIIANIFQIIDFLEKHLGKKKKIPKKEIEEKFYKVTKDLEITYCNPFLIPEQETPETRHQ